MKITWVDRELLTSVAARAIQNVEVVLDIGCGIVPQNYIKPDVHICCEPCLEYVEHLQRFIATTEPRDRSYVILSIGWEEAVRAFPFKSVDTVFLLDVIEHLEKDVGKRLLVATENLARKQVVIFTPLGFMPQHHDDGKDAWGLNGGNWQEHKSGWTPEDFVGDEWRFFASNDFHSAASKYDKSMIPYGAFWAIKTNPGCHAEESKNREAVLKALELDLMDKQIFLARRESEISSLVLVSFERKVRRLSARIKNALFKLC